jgi:hypothetical protein
MSAPVIKAPARYATCASELVASLWDATMAARSVHDHSPDGLALLILTAFDPDFDAERESGQ